MVREKAQTRLAEIVRTLRRYPDDADPRRVRPMPRSTGRDTWSASTNPVNRGNIVMQTCLPPRPSTRRGSTRRVGSSFGPGWDRSPGSESIWSSSTSPR